MVLKKLESLIFFLISLGLVALLFFHSSGQAFGITNVRNWDTFSHQTSHIGLPIEFCLTMCSMGFVVDPDDYSASGKYKVWSNLWGRHDKKHRQNFTQFNLNFCTLIGIISSK